MRLFEKTEERPVQSQDGADRPVKWEIRDQLDHRDQSGYRVFARENQDWEEWDLDLVAVNEDQEMELV